MMKRVVVLLSALGGCLVGGAITFGLLNNPLSSSHGAVSSHSPYVSQTNSPVRGLSAQEVDDLLVGREHGGGQDC